MVGRVVQHVVDAGIRQIIDIGSGLPTQDNVHEIAHRTDPEVRVVYVDNDQLVAAHARALLVDSTHVGVVHQDLLRPDDVLGDPALRDLVDLDQPVALLMTLVLHMVPAHAGPHEALAAYREALAPGSFLAITHARNDSRTELMTRVSAVSQRSDIPFEPRSRKEIALLRRLPTRTARPGRRVALPGAPRRLRPRSRPHRLRWSGTDRSRHRSRRGRSRPVRWVDRCGPGAPARPPSVRRWTEWARPAGTSTPVT